jgi:putative ABC transport system ATP-binding protein
MNILGALDRPTSGLYFLKGRRVDELSDNKLADFRNREVGFVFQQFNLLKKTNVRDNVALPGLYGEVRNIMARAKKVLKDVGLADKENNFTNQLSGGQMQRVAIARALMMKPSIIMADEPTGNLDSRTAHGIMHIFEKINEAGNTIILVTHEKDIAAYAKRVVVLKDGRIISDRKK